MGATIEDIMARKLPRAIRPIAVSITILLIAVIGYVYFANVDEMVTVPGKLTWSSPKIVISSSDLAVVESQDVDVAETVTRGQVLATLRSLEAEADYKQLQIEGVISLANIGRLSLELEDIEMPEGPPSSYLAAVDTISLGEIDAAAFWRDQWELYTRRLFNHSREAAAIQANITKLEGQLKSLQANVETLQKRVPIHEEIEGIKSKLLEKGVGSRLAYLHAAQERMAAESAVSTAKRDLADVVTHLEREKGRLLVHELSRRSQIAAELDDARRKNSSLLARLNVLAERAELTNVVAPTDAVVLERAERAAGSVVQKGEHLFTMLPVDGHYRIQLMIPPRDIARLKGDETLRVKFASLPFQRYGYLEGKIESISSDVVPMPGYPDREPMQIYVGNATIDPGSKLRNVPDDFKPLPGTPLTVEIVVGQRRLASYFTYPLARIGTTALRESDLGPAPPSVQ